MGQSRSQKPPEIGQPFRDFFLDRVENYPKKNISHSDLKGKWIFLDFWGEGCSGCIASFPKINELQKKFSKDIQFVLVTTTGKDPRTAMSLFKKLRDKFDLTIPVSYDQNFVHRVGPSGFPTTVIINPSGIVETITNYVEEANIVDLLRGKKTNMARGFLLSQERPSHSYDYNTPLLLNNNGGNETNYLYRSVIAEWKYSMKRDWIIKNNRLEGIGMDLKRLYRFAYFGIDSWNDRDTAFYNKYYRSPILEIKDSTLFIPEFTDIPRNIFCYSLSFATDVFSENPFGRRSIVDRHRFMRIMQKDLESYFGFKGIVERRIVPVYKLVASNEGREKLITKGGSEILEFPNGGKSLTARNASVDYLLGLIIGSIGYPYEEMPIVNETGITGNIDIKIDAVYFDDWLKELRKLGLDLIPGKKEMNVLVIRDIEKDE
jgi:thiol-disulfide isomerase/thioredoxin